MYLQISAQRRVSLYPARLCCCYSPYVCRGLANMRPSLVTMPTPTLLAEPSIPRAIVTAGITALQVQHDRCQGFDQSANATDLIKHCRCYRLDRCRESKWSPKPPNVMSADGKCCQHQSAIVAWHWPLPGTSKLAYALHAGPCWQVAARLAESHVLILLVGVCW